MHRRVLCTVCACLTASVATAAWLLAYPLAMRAVKDNGAIHFRMRLLRNAEARAGNREAELPGAINMVLKVSGLYTWHQMMPDGEWSVTRFAVGEMCNIVPAGRKDHGYDQCFTDAASGGRARVPSLMKSVAAGGRMGSFTYAVPLSQVNCTLVSSVDEQFFIPTLKACAFG